MNLSRGTYRFSPTGERSADDPGMTEGMSEAPTDLTPLLFSAVDRIEAEKALRDLEQALETRVPDALSAVLAKRSVTLRSAGRFRWRVERDPGAPPLIEIFASPDGFRLFSAAGGDETISAPPNESALHDLALHVDSMLVEEEHADRRYEQAVVQIGGMALPSHVAVEAESETPGTHTWSFTDVTDDEARATVTVEITRSPLRISLDGSEVASVQVLEEILPDRITRQGTGAAAGTAVGDAMDRILAGTREPAFATYIESRAIRCEPAFRDTQDFFSLDLYRIDGNTLFGSFGVHKETGEIFLLDSDEIVVTTLANAGADPMTAILGAMSLSSDENNADLPDDFPVGFQPGTSRSGGINIVLLGVHENRADAIMLLHLGPDKTISMISIPRDIWWESRKLNILHEIYGAPYLVQQISRMIDQTIDGWVSVDMYAFINMVDILGGIDITLSEPLVDPTYRVRNRGTWETLFYPAGTHHVNGIEALRIARSRHTSNDFERASRQQLILEALRSRLNDLHAGNLNQVYRIAETLGSYVESSYSVWELAQLFLAYRNAEIVRKTGLTFDNVLYNTWSNLYLRGLDRNEVDDSFYLGAWILLPRGDNWDVIPWFVEENLTR